MDKEQLINDIIFFQERLDELWQYHQDNPEKVNVEDEFDRIQKIILSLESEIKNAD